MGSQQWKLTLPFDSAIPSLHLPQVVTAQQSVPCKTAPLHTMGHTASSSRIAGTYQVENKKSIQAYHCH